MSQTDSLQSLHDGDRLRLPNRREHELINFGYCPICRPGVPCAKGKCPKWIAPLVCVVVMLTGVRDVVALNYELAEIGVAATRPPPLKGVAISNVAPCIKALGTAGVCNFQSRGRFSQTCCHAPGLYLDQAFRC